MTESVMINIKETLSKSRELCPGLSEAVYALADYLAIYASYGLTATGLLRNLMLSLNDISNEKEGTDSPNAKDVFKYICGNKTQVLAQAVYIPQIVDVAFGGEFAEEFRKICKEKLDLNPFRRYERYDPNADIIGDYEDYVKVAVNWWANALITPIVSDISKNLDDSSIIFMTREFANLTNDVSKSQIDIFKEGLARSIVTKMETSKNKKCRLDIKSNLLVSLVKKAEMPLFPLEATMNVSSSKVEVSLGKGAPYQNIWKKRNVAG